MATPGRLFDLLKLGALKLDTVKHLVLDEADEMLSMGFRNEVVRVAEMTASRRSTWLFSATFPEKIQRLIADCMPPDPKVIKVEKAQVVNRNISHRYVLCQRDDKDDWIADFLLAQKTERGMPVPNDSVFVHIHRLDRPISIRRNHRESIPILSFLIKS